MARRLAQRWSVIDDPQTDESARFAFPSAPRVKAFLLVRSTVLRAQARRSPESCHARSFARVTWPTTFFLAIGTRVERGREPKWSIRSQPTKSFGNAIAKSEPRAYAIKGTSSSPPHSIIDMRDEMDEGAGSLGQSDLTMTNVAILHAMNPQAARRSGFLLRRVSKRTLPEATPVEETHSGSNLQQIQPHAALRASHRCKSPDDVCRRSSELAVLCSRSLGVGFHWPTSSIMGLSRSAASLLHATRCTQHSRIEFEFRWARSSIYAGLES